jgi:hypothetical protein
MVIPPGGQDKITLKLKTQGYKGILQRRARVFSNDPRGTRTLSLRADVRTPIDVSSRYVRLKGPSEEVVSRFVDITANRDEPLLLKPGYFDLEDQVNYRIEELEKGKSYRVHITSVPEQAQSFLGFLKLETNYGDMPEISLRIRRQITKAEPRRR